MALTGAGLSPDTVPDSFLSAPDNDVDTSAMFLTAAEEIIEHLDTGERLPSGTALPGVVLPSDDEDEDGFVLIPPVPSPNTSASSLGSVKTQVLHAQLLCIEAQLRASESEQEAMQLMGRDHRLPQAASGRDPGTPALPFGKMLPVSVTGSPSRHRLLTGWLSTALAEQITAPSQDDISVRRRWR